MKTFQFLTVGIVLIVLIFLGFFVVGTHFWEKTQEYSERNVNAQEERNEARRAKKVAKAKDANVDETRIKELNECLKRVLYTKRSSYQDLKKTIRKSKNGLTCWYEAEADEDFEQARNYIAYYKRQEETFRAKLAATKKALDECVAEIEALQKNAEEIENRNSDLERAAGTLSERFEQTRTAHQKAVNELEVTPKFRRADPEKKVKALERQMKKQEEIARKILAETKANDERLSSVDRQIQALRERKGTLDDLAEEYEEEIEICVRAGELSRSIFSLISEIRYLKEEILDYESTRDDKRIDAYL